MAATVNNLFREIDVRNYPYPITAIINNYNKVSQSNLSERHSLLCDIFETLIKFTGSILIAELSSSSLFNKFYPNGLGCMKHPSLGHWLSVIREPCKANIEIADNELFLLKIKQWYNGDKPDKEILNCYKDALPEISFQKGLSAVAGITESLVTYRNKLWKGHGASSVKEQSLIKRIPALELLLIHLLQSADFLPGLNLFWVNTSEVIDKNRQNGKGTSLAGTELAHCEYISKEYEPGEIYIAYSPTNKAELDREPIVLSPMVEWQKNENGDFRFYFYNDGKRTKLEYLCYTDGSFYHHREVKDKLEKVFGVHLSKGSEDNEYIMYNFSEEERMEKCRNYSNIAQEKYTKGNFEDAIVYYEQALEWHRTPDLIVDMCQAMYKLKEDPEYIHSILEEAFELSPDFQPALQLLAKLKGVDTEKNIDDDDRKLDLKEGNFTYCDLMVPAKFRNISLLVVIMAVFAYFTITSLGMALLDKSGVIPAALTVLSENGVTSDNLAAFEAKETTSVSLAALREKGVTSAAMKAFEDRNGKKIIADPEKTEDTSASLADLEKNEVLSDALAALNKQESHLFKDVAINTLMMFEILVVFLVIFFSKTAYLSSYFSLYGQLDNMRQERFNEIFKEYYGKMFGFFRVKKDEKNNFSLKPVWEKEKIILLFCLAFFITWTVCIIPVQELYKRPIPILLIRFLSSAILWMILPFLMRYIIFSTLFIKQYSKLDLNPVVSAVGNDGFSSLSKICSINTIALGIFWVLNWGWNAFAVNDPYYIDFLGLLFSVVMASFWMILVPYFIRVALKLSKSTATSIYQDHVKHSFKKFIKNPEEASIDRYKWLVDNEKTVLNISTRIFTFTQWINFIIFVFVIFSSTYLYIVYRLGCLDGVISKYFG